MGSKNCRGIRSSAGLEMVRMVEGAVRREVTTNLTSGWKEEKAGEEDRGLLAAINWSTAAAPALSLDR
jgi:hypothetical protein